MDLVLNNLQRLICHETLQAKQNLYTDFRGKFPYITYRFSKDADADNKKM